MLVALLFLLAAGAILLAVAVVALGRQVRAARRATAPIALATRLHGARALERAPIVTTFSLDGVPLTIGGASRDPQALLLVFVEPDSEACDRVIDDATGLCRGAAVRLLVAGDGRSSDYERLLRARRLARDRLVVDGDLKICFKVSALPAAALIDPEGRLLAQGLVQDRSSSKA